MPRRPRPDHRRPAGRGPAPASARPVLAPGATVTIVHAKPWQRTITMRGTVRAWDGELLTVERQFSGGGFYDSLDVPKLAGDWGIVEIPRGSWVLRRAYYRRGSALIGELFNVQTPAEIDESGVRYVDLEVDVVRWPDGRVRIVDEHDLDAAVRVGGVQPEAAARARVVARRLVEILRAGGDWHTADDAQPDA